MKIDAAPEIVKLIGKYDELHDQIHKSRLVFAKLAQVLINPVTVRFRPDPPTGYGLSFNMSAAELPDLKQLGDKIHEWQKMRQELIRILADPKTDKRTCLYLDAKLHVRIRGC